MKQIVITVPLQGKTSLEVEDFLNGCTGHSAEWIGEIDNWKINSIQVHKDRYDKILQATALLENSKWKAPQVKAMTGNYVFKAIEGKENHNLKIGRQEGLGNNFRELPVSCYEKADIVNGYNVLSFDNSFRVPINISEIIKSIGHKAFEDDDIRPCWEDEDGERDLQRINELCKEIAKLPVAIRLSRDSQAAYPLTSVEINGNTIEFAINCDIEIKYN